MNTTPQLACRFATPQPSPSLLRLVGKTLSRKLGHVLAVSPSGAMLALSSLLAAAKVAAGA